MLFSHSVGRNTNQAWGIFKTSFSGWLSLCCWPRRVCCTEEDNVPLTVVGELEFKLRRRVYPPPRSVDVKDDDPNSFAMPFPPDIEADPWPEADSKHFAIFLIVVTLFAIHYIKDFGLNLNLL